MKVFGLIIIMLKQEGFSKVADGYCKRSLLSNLKLRLKLFLLN